MCLNKTVVQESVTSNIIFTHLLLCMSKVREEDGGDALTLTGLQTLLTEEYGEAHFNATGQRVHPVGCNLARGSVLPETLSTLPVPARAVVKSRPFFCRLGLETFRLCLNIFQSFASQSFFVGW